MTTSTGRAYLATLPVQLCQAPPRAAPVPVLQGSRRVTFTATTRATDNKGERVRHIEKSLFEEAFKTTIPVKDVWITTNLEYNRPSRARCVIRERQLRELPCRKRALSGAGAETQVGLRSMSQASKRQIL